LFEVSTVIIGYTSSRTERDLGILCVTDTNRKFRVRAVNGIATTICNSIWIITDTRVKITISLLRVPCTMIVESAISSTSRSAVNVKCTRRGERVCTVEWLTRVTIRLDALSRRINTKPLNNKLGTVVIRSAVR